MSLQPYCRKPVIKISPETSITEACTLMEQNNVGSLVAEKNGKLCGIVTDRDIVIRGIAQGKGPKAKVRDVMTKDVKYCFDDQEVEEVTRNMADIQVRRLPVLNRDKRLVGILSLGDIALSTDGQGAGDALCGISRPGGEHTQTG